MTWDPAQYLKYEGHRLRPAIDLIARIPLAAPGTIVDLGCGAGNVARVLADRFAGATIDGVDSDKAMLARARAEGDAQAVRRYAMTGVPQAIASIITSPKGSGQSIGNSSAAALERKSCLPRSSISPASWICSPSISGLSCSLK